MAEFYLLPFLIVDITGAKDFLPTNDTVRGE
jgi:hypothetical protein